jgi:hypothetical protein
MLARDEAERRKAEAEAVAREMEEQYRKAEAKMQQ